ncbi:MAG TPA: hypothetical protein ENO23_10800, partial [Alphaproteobacteria bacterium]|nr:hypothetical protein [Alphaproteobacteria bacterium]
MQRPYAIVVHGGAGPHRSGGLAERMQGCETAAARGLEVLQNRGSALDAVQAAVVVLEDHPLFNAGRGAPLNAAGEVELDASIMDGRDLRAGAVAAVQGVPNPVALARAVLEDGRHVLLAGDGARAFARQHGVALCDPGDLVSDAQRQRWRERFGTVGAVALDARGFLAAATSTGGLFGKLPGRIGDSALIGSGTYADASAAVSCTGHGEAIIRVVLAKLVCDHIGAGEAPGAAAREAVDRLGARTAGEAGLIVLD